MLIQIVKHAFASIPLLEIIRVLSERLANKASPSASPPSFPKELQERSKNNNEVFTDKELARSTALCSLIIFQLSFSDCNCDIGDRRSSAMASPPVIRSGLTTFRASADPILLFDKSISVRTLFFLIDVINCSHS